jgi:hypothetical protein
LSAALAEALMAKLSKYKNPYDMAQFLLS